MHNYLTSEALKGFSLKASDLLEHTLASKQAVNERRHSVFLSHSHKDKDIVKNAVAFLKSLGVNVYVDWMDEGMPSETTPETARKIKGKIKEHRKFVVLATANSKESKWVPWELGYADTAKGIQHIAILPVADSATTYAGTEFVGIYPIIRKSFTDGSWIVRLEEPSIFTDLSSWLTT